MGLSPQVTRYLPVGLGRTLWATFCSQLGKDWHIRGITSLYHKIHL